MAKSTKKVIDTEVLEVEAEEILDAPKEVVKIISQELAKLDKFETRIAELKEMYSGLTIKDENDKDGYENVRLAIADLRGIRTGSKQDVKVGKAPFWNACKSFDGKYNWIITEVSQIEDPLQARKDEIDAIKEKAKAENKAAQEHTYTQRSMELSKMGVLFDGTNFVLEDASFEGVLVREADEEVWNDFILPKFKTIFDKHEAVRLEEERIKNEQIEKERLEREQFAQAQKELQEQQATLLKQQQEADRKEQERIKKEEDEAQKEKMQIFNKRLDMLTGYIFNGSMVKGPSGLNLGSVDYVANLSDEVFFEMVNVNNAAIELKAKQDEEKRQADIIRIQEEAATKERERIAEENRQKELKRQQEEQAKAEELAKAGDKAKWDDYISKIKAITKPQFRSSQYRKASLIAEQKINEVITIKP